MTETPALKTIGRIQKTFGTEGDLLLSVFEEGAIKLNEPVILVIEGLPVPFFVTSLQEKSNKILVHLENVDSASAAEEFVRMDVFADPLRYGTTSAPADTTELLAEADVLIDMNFLDKSTNRRGTIRDYFDFPGNPCIALYYNDAPEVEVLLPLHPEFIIGINTRKNLVTLRTPEGL